MGYLEQGKAMAGSAMLGDEGIPGWAKEEDHVHCRVLARASSRSCSGRLGFGAGGMMIAKLWGSC